MTIQGLHHITIVCRDAQRTIDFYCGVLGLRLVKKTVNFDTPKAIIFTSATTPAGRARPLPFLSGRLRPKAIPVSVGPITLPCVCRTTTACSNGNAGSPALAWG